MSDNWVSSICIGAAIFILHNLLNIFEHLLSTRCYTEWIKREQNPNLATHLPELVANISSAAMNYIKHTYFSTKLRGVLSNRIFCNVEMFYICAVLCVAINHFPLLSTWNVANATEELNFKFYLLFSKFNLI